MHHLHSFDQHTGGRVEIRITIDDAALERLVRRVLEQMSGERPASRPSRAFLANCGRPADLLRVIEAPDTQAPGIRSEPHWRVMQEVAAGDVIVFRARDAKSLVGHARAARCEHGEHRQQPGIPAIRWWLEEPVRYEPPLPDGIFLALFEEHQRTTPGVPLLQRDRNFAPKAYLYPLDRAVFAAVCRAAGVETGIADGPSSGGADAGAFG